MTHIPQNKVLIDIPELIRTPRLTLQMSHSSLAQQVHEAILDGYEDHILWLRANSKPPTLEQVSEECRIRQAQFITRELISYVITDDQNKVIGRCAFPPVHANWSIPQFGVSYFIRKSERNKGYATEAARTMTMLAFRDLDAKKVEIHCQFENVASQQIPIKLGFQIEYSQKGNWLTHDGELANIHTYSIFSEKDLSE